MIYANITNFKILHTGIFRINITLSEELNDFVKSDIDLRAKDGNGIDGVQFEFSGKGREYSLQVYPPQESCGAFEVAIAREGITANPRIFAYDTCTQIVAEFGEHIRTDDTITVPISFPFDLSVFNRGSMHISYDLDGLTYQVFGEGRAYRIVLSPRGNGTVKIALHRATKINGVQVSVVGAWTLVI